jgi:hypothetical protein
VIRSEPDELERGAVNDSTELAGFKGNKEWGGHHLVFHEEEKVARHGEKQETSLLTFISRFIVKSRFGTTFHVRIVLF